jgi:hypothetical protein
MMTWLKKTFSRLRGWFDLTLAAVGSGLSPGTLASWALQYGPVIMALIRVLEEGKNDEERKAAVADFERAFRILSETKNPALLEDAIRRHCRPDTGCMLP